MIGLLRFRNESLILQDTLWHMSFLCDRIYCYDDASTDDSVKIAKSFSKVKNIIENKMWDTNQQFAQAEQRTDLFEYAKKKEPVRDYFLYLDADERIDWNDYLYGTFPNALEQMKTGKCDGIRMKFFDFYLTPDDHEPYKKGEDLSKLRKWVGPEFRDILIVFNRKAIMNPELECMREPYLEPNRIIKAGYVKHYGKSISIEYWEETCNYYSKYVPVFAKKWKARKDKAIHTKSDFGNELILYEEAKRRYKICQEL